MIKLEAFNPSAIAFNLLSFDFNICAFWHSMTYFIVEFHFCFIKLICFVHFLINCKACWSSVCLIYLIKEDLKMFLNCNRQSSSIDSSRNIFSVTLFWAGMFSVCKFNISFAYFRTPKAFEHVYSASVVSTSLSLILELYCFFTSESQI